MFRKLMLTSAVSLVLLPGTSWSLGLGGIRTQSALNEPFVGEIDLYDAKRDELDSVNVVLADAAAFAKVGVERAHFLTSLKFVPQVSAKGRTVVRVTSRDAIREPYLDFLVAVTWPKGRMIKEYTVLLDPPVRTSRPAPRVERPRTVRRSQAQARPSQPRTQSRPTAVARDWTGYPLRYGPVESGVGLWRIARTMAPSGATIAQTAMALYRNNQSAFIRGDINKLKLGANLSIPTPDELYALDRNRAEREFRSALSGGRVTRAPITDVTSTAAPTDHLKIAGPPAGATGTSPGTMPRAGGLPQPELGKLQEDLLMVQEAGESTRQETGEMQARIDKLETQLKDIRALLQLRNEQLAQIQSSQLGQEDIAVAETVEELSTDQAVEKPSGVQAPVESLDPDLPAEKPAEAPRTAETVQEEAQPAKPSVSELVATSGEGEKATLADAPPAARPFWRDLLSSPVALGSIVTVLLGLLAVLMVRRRRRLDETLDMSAFTTEEATASVKGEAPRQERIDSEVKAASSMQGGLDSSQLSAPYSGFTNIDDETDDADALSEADVYIAYGRYREAETLLREEIERSPERLDLKFKLAEAYYGSRSRESLQELINDMRLAGAEDLHPIQWKRLIAMSEELDGSTTPSTLASEEMPHPAAAPLPFDLKMASSQTTQRSGIEALSDAVSDFSLSGLTEDDRAGATPAAEMSAAKAHETQTLSFELEDLEVGGEELGLPAADSGAAVGASDLELKLDSLSNFADFELDKLTREETQVKPDAGQPGLAPSTGTTTAALLDSLDITPVGKDSTASDVLSSQWQMDSGLWDEVATKIDLARAYMEMEDPDAARVILEEVGDEGNEEQKAEAQEMIARLGET